MSLRISLFAFSALIAGSAQAAPQEKLRDLLVRGAIAGSHGFVVENPKYYGDDWYLATMDLLKKEKVSPDVIRCVDEQLKKELGGDLLDGVLDLISAFENIGAKHQEVVGGLKINKDRGLPLEEIRKDFAWSMDAFIGYAPELMVAFQAGYLKAQSAARSVDIRCSGTAVPAPRAPKNP